MKVEDTLIRPDTICMVSWALNIQLQTLCHGGTYFTMGTHVNFVTAIRILQRVHVCALISRWYIFYNVNTV